MNKCTIIGNITREVKLRSVNTANGPVNVCDFSVAVSDRRRKDANGQPETTFFNCTAWRGLADVVARYGTRGTKVAVTGPVSARAYTANDGTQKASIEVQVEDFEFCGGGARTEEAAPAQAEAPAQAPTQNAVFTPVTDDTNLPF